ncbi:MAG: glycosyltransferase family 2 protein [Candidatus Omnitrophica bacterium]|nr:glycosyltransferase family 2 protein [Candidatus Omnitrophota bacterium]MBU1997780.1 glycosyltransferase family 2 protein [Candidatus Omnitrophota bacterium]MBU4334153.1 glycosyltransferase family 2 protein [Candidatus Omnitrophota bacterium]
MNEIKIKRILEAVPGLISWAILLCLLVLFIMAPLFAVLTLIVYLMYWVCRLSYMTALLLAAHFRMHSRRNYQWIDMCKKVKTDLCFNDVLHVVLYPTYKESKELIETSLDSLRKSNYPKDKVLVVLAGEERDVDAKEMLNGLKKHYLPFFNNIIVTIHPDNIEGEIPSKGSNATYAAKKIKDYLIDNDIRLEHVIISCFDADTCPDENYLACLTYHYLTNSKRHQTSYQPLPIYNNNIYQAPALARVIEIGSTFWQLIESMRYGKVITFSSHSMSFKTLVEVGYWPVDMISDDSVIFWKCFLHFDGDYRTYPLERPVYMDIAVGKNIFDTIKIQYKQKRRWAWGVENFVYVSMHFLKYNNISFLKKFSRIYQLLDNHVNWATWAIIISFITPFFICWGKVTSHNTLVFLNLAYINGIISNALIFVLILSFLISKYFMPPRPANISRMIYVSFVLQWLLLPFISAVLGSLPALDAQTRLIFGKTLVFNRTKKGKKRK